MKILLTQGEITGIAPEITEKLEAHNDLFSNELYILRSKNTDFNLHKIKNIYIEDILDKNYSKLKFTDKQREHFNKLIQSFYKFFPSKINENYSTALSIYFGALLVYIGFMDVLITNPVSKKILSNYIPNFTGHTGFLKEIFSVSNALMVMSCKKIPPVAILTEHIPLKDVSAVISTEKIELALKLLRDSFNINLPIAVAALNPHAGDKGLISDEEKIIITPAIKKMKSIGINVIGPIPTDTLFTHKNLINLGGILTLYHDQGMLIPKYACFDSLVNITLGLPIVRTSPGHGVAFDIVGKGLASEMSLKNAILTAVKLKK